MSLPPFLINFFSQVIEDPVEIIDNALELKGFHNIEEDIKLVGFFKSQKSERTYLNGLFPPTDKLFEKFTCGLVIFRLP